MAYPSIHDYAIIGDSHTAALISRDGSVDWLCLPRFDSPSVFGALLDENRGGRLRLRPKGPYTVQRRYVGDTNVLETTFRTERGALRVLDAMAVTGEAEKRRLLWPSWLLVRAVECLEGEVEVEAYCAPRPRYASTVPRLRSREELGFTFEWGSEVLAVRSDLRLRYVADTALEGSATLGRGERRYVCLTYARHEPVIIPPFGPEAVPWLERTRRWWEAWASRCRYDGPYREAVLRSALVLKLLIYAPSGALIAAPTTSLPERIGGDLNWDYRFCWLRDASLMLRALQDLGFSEEGEAFFSWLLHATQLTWPELRVMYSVFGEAHLPERTLDHLEGYARSSPVRIGNAAARQRQLDIYGEVASAAYGYVRRGGRLDWIQARRLGKLSRAVCKLWQMPDSGIWESRSEPAHYTLSKAQCWIALDRLLQLHHEGHIRVPVERVTAERDAIREKVEAEGYNEEDQTYVDTLGGRNVDASLLLLALRDYIDPKAPRMLATLRRIRQDLGAGSLIYRNHQDGPEGQAAEGAFGICSFWAVECLARAGHVEEAQQAFEQLLSYRNDVGLYGEEIDPDTGATLGNFPQAFTHAGLISAALALAEGTGKQVAGDDAQHRDTAAATPQDAQHG